MLPLDTDIGLSRIHGKSKVRVRPKGANMAGAKRRMERERVTVDRMIRIYCQGNHGGGKGLCPGCQDLMEYAAKKLARCPFREEKPTCGRCEVHCYSPKMRERITEVMRYAGPRMFFRHPGLSLLHFLDQFRKAPH
jgi:hypothetical protein